jgi:uncharacterized protein (TIGR02300 family)
MATKDLGNKYVCFKCSAKFYDLKKPIPTCPKCGTDQRDQPVVKQSSRRAPAARAVEEAEEKPEVEETDEDDEEDEVEEKPGADE